MAQDGPMDPAASTRDAASDAASRRSEDAPGQDVVRARPQVPALPRAVALPLDVALGAASVVVAPAVRVTAAVVSWARPPAGALLRAAARPPLVPVQWTPGELVARLEHRGTAVRRAAAYDAVTAVGRGADLAVPAVADLVLDRIALTEVVLSRVELLRVVDAVLDQLDLTAVVLDRVDLRQVVTEALDSLDLTEVVVDRVQLGRVVTAALDAVDLTEVVVDRVDLDRVVTTVLDGMDLTELVRTRVDLPALADQVIEEVDLPEIIRESSTCVASDVVQGARMGALDADERVSQLVDRLLLRRRARRVDTPNADPVDPGKGAS
jgi:hypothetical protein